jgi:serine/threonine protein kinase
MSDADGGALRETYRDLSEIERRPEGVRYHATLSGGVRVHAIALSDDVTSRIRHSDRFVRAFERAAAVRHQAIAAPLAWGRADNCWHCAFARTESVELKPGSLSPSDVAVLGVQLTRALTSIHGAGLVHGGISTASIAQSMEQGVQLLRFGLFAALNDGGLGVQGAAMRLSHAAYVAPEVQNGASPDERSDIFSLGASLYDLLTGKPPYGGRTTSFVMASVLSNQEGATDVSNDAIAGPVIEALMRAIERAPDDRWPSAAAFGQALAIAAGSAELAAPRQAQPNGWIRGIFNRWFPARRSRS